MKPYRHFSLDKRNACGYTFGMLQKSADRQALRTTGAPFSLALDKGHPDGQSKSALAGP